jgi:hypothetical protein
MSSRINRELLHQQWVHAYEEDTPTEAVYRPAGYELPPARGRTGFELRPDQTERRHRPNRCSRGDDRFLGA